MATKLQEEEEVEDAIQLKKAMEKACQIFRKYIVKRAKELSPGNTVKFEDSCSLWYSISDPGRKGLFYNRLIRKAEGQTGVTEAGSENSIRFHNETIQETEAIINSLEGKWTSFQKGIDCVLNATTVGSCRDV